MWQAAGVNPPFAGVSCLSRAASSWAISRLHGSVHARQHVGRDASARCRCAQRGGSGNPGGQQVMGHRFQRTCCLCSCQRRSAVAHVSAQQLPAVEGAATGAAVEGAHTRARASSGHLSVRVAGGQARVPMRELVRGGGARGARICSAECTQRVVCVRQCWLSKCKWYVSKRVKSCAYTRMLH